MKVSVLMITYNHEQFIAQAIESALMQQTAFAYELVIGEDCSTDSTRKIVAKYAEKFPERIVPFFHTRNIGIVPNFIHVYQACRGEYVAILEGDDFWTDPLKLQKQVEFLDMHPDYTSCFHGIKILYQEIGTMQAYTAGPLERQSFYTVDDILEHGAFPATCSIMARNRIFGDIPKWLPAMTHGDFVIHVLNGLYGKLGVLDETMAVYRVHKSGTCGGAQEWVVLEKNVQDYLRVGKQLHLEQRPSYRQGLYKQSCGLLYSYLAQNAYRKALRLSPLVLKYAPSPKIKIHIGVDLLRAWISPLRRRFRIQILGILKRCCGENPYNHLKRFYHKRRGQIKALFAKFSPLRQQTWQEIEYFDDTWKRRIKKLSELIEDEQSILDIGCGEMWLKAYLPEHITYYGCDYKKRDETTLIYDFNKKEFPPLTVECCFISGCLEYIEDVDWFLDRLKECCQAVILSYCSTELNPDMQARTGLCWVNHLSVTDVLKAFTKRGFTLLKQETPVDGNEILKFKKFARNAAQL